ncbi:MAG: GNAT family N-acetyltransferase [Verrucomicrobiota bacterium]
MTTFHSLGLQDPEHLLIQKTQNDIGIYRGSSLGVIYVPQILKMLKKGITRGEDLRFRNIEELQLAFEEKRCIYALDARGEIIGFVFFYIQHSVPSKKPFLYHSAFIIQPSYRSRGLGRIMKQIAFGMARNSHPKVDILSLTCHPAIIAFNQKLGFQEITLSKIFEIFGFDVSHDFADCPNLSIQIQERVSKKSISKDIRIVHTPTGRIFKPMVFFADENAKIVQ